MTSGTFTANGIWQALAWAPKLRQFLSSAPKTLQRLFVVGWSCAGKWSVKAPTILDYAAFSDNSISGRLLVFC